MKRSINNALATIAMMATAAAAPGVAHAGTYTHADTYTSTASNWYGGVSGDLTWLRHSDTGGGGNVDIGYRFDDFRVEGEAGYHAAKGRDGFSSTHYFTWMGNVYYDFNKLFPSYESGWHISPYVGGGLGDAAVHSGGSNFINTFHHHENEFAYQGMAGLTFTSASMPNTDWRIGYRYTGTDNNNIHANNLEIGVNFHF